MYRIVILALLVAILASLFSALRFLLRGNDAGEKAGMRTVRALTLRIGLSLLLFVLLLLGFHFGILPQRG